MKKWFNSQSRLIQLILLIIPFVGWVVELLVRWETFLDKKDVVSLVLAIIFTFGGWVLAYVDLVWVLLFNHLLGASN